MKLLRFLKDWTLPTSMTCGVLLYLVLANFQPVAPYKPLLERGLAVVQPTLLFMMLMLTFCRVKPSDMQFRVWHLWLLGFQLLLFSALIGVICMLHGSMLLEGAALCMICPTATAAAVITRRLGGNAVVTECILSNSYDRTYECDANSSIRFSGSLSDGDTLSAGNLYGDAQFTSATNFILIPADLKIGSTYLPETPQAEPVISEICFHPTLDSESEYIRIYNPANTPFDLSGYTLSQAFDFTFPEGSRIPAQKSIYVAANASKLSPKVNGDKVWQWTDGKLSNNGESIRLSNPAGIVVDQVTYMSVAPWPVSEQSGTTALLLRDLNADNHMAANWTLTQYPTDVKLIPAVQGSDIIYDLNGRLIEGQPQGIVIINGKLYYYKQQ